MGLLGSSRDRPRQVLFSCLEACAFRAFGVPALVAGSASWYIGRTNSQLARRAYAVSCHCCEFWPSGTRRAAATPKLAEIYWKRSAVLGISSSGSRTRRSLVHVPGHGLRHSSGPERRISPKDPCFVAQKGTRDTSKNKRSWCLFWLLILEHSHVSDPVGGNTTGCLLASPVRKRSPCSASVRHLSHAGQVTCTGRNDSLHEVHTTTIRTMKARP